MQDHEAQRPAGVDVPPVASWDARRAQPRPALRCEPTDRLSNADCMLLEAPNRAATCFPDCQAHVTRFAPISIAGFRGRLLTFHHCLALAPIHVGSIDHRTATEGNPGQQIGLGARFIDTSRRPLGETVSCFIILPSSHSHSCPATSESLESWTVR